jgi:uncharacterized protein
MTAELIALSAAVFGLAGFVKGVIGLGLPAVAMGLLGSLISPAQAAALLIVPSIITNIWQMAQGPALSPLLRRLWPMLAGVLVGTWAASGMLTGPNTRATLAALGVALMAYAAVGLLPWKLPLVPPRHERWVGALAGLGSGVMTAATGVFVIPAVPFMGALGLTRDELVQSLGISFTVSTAALAVSLGSAGAFNLDMAWASAACLLPALIGMSAGNWVRKKVSAETFRRWFFLGLLLLGAQILVRALGLT